jgi:RNA polymerase sigma-70 factor (ECF subfamily)
MISDSLPVLLSRTTAAISDRATSHTEKSAIQPHDNQLIERIQQKDREALGLLFNRYAKLVFAVGAQILRNATEAQDLVQDIFLQVYEKCYLFDPSKGTASAWLLRIACSRAFDRREYLNIRGSSDISVIDEDGELTHAQSAPESLTEAILAKQIMERAFSQLTHRERLTLQMFFFEGYTLREISSHLAETIVNTRHHYYRGIEKLRQVVDQPPKGARAAGGK